MPPLADTMRFIDRDLRNVPIQRALQKILHHQPLRRDVEQTKLVAIESAQSLARLTASKRRIQERRRNPARPQRIDLILHQRDLRRLYNRDVIVQQRRQLKTKRLSTASR